MFMKTLALAGLLASGQGQPNLYRPAKITDLDCVKILSERDRTQRCDFLEEQIIDNRVERRSKSAAEKKKTFDESRKVSDELVEEYINLDCTHIPLQYPQHRTCGVVHDAKKKSVLEKSDLRTGLSYDLFCQDKIQRQLDVESCEFMTKYPYARDYVDKCVMPGETYIRSDCQRDGAHADWVYRFNTDTL
ncbi:hypothetical protein KBC04_03090 [Candidatus Babeliales bacterium]|nr:hypothetical protein [Candidatus Babeliales bacterium]MBP9843964.1 hypothetical protein [Candidatus Babeliales bacterium]